VPFAGKATGRPLEPYEARDFADRRRLLARLRSGDPAERAAVLEEFQRRWRCRVLVHACEPVEGA